MTSSVDKDFAKPSNFLRSVIENDLEQGVYAARKWGGSPGDAQHHAQGMQDPAKVRTRFPPEPNGYLHIGHAKSIWLNFELAKEFGGVCHLRFDDTNPEKEEQEYVDSIRDAVKWLGYETYLTDSPVAPGTLQPHEYFASDYFDFMYRAAEYLINAGLAYVDEQTPDQMRAARGDFNTPGTDSPFRTRSPEENLARFRQMRDGELEDGGAILRAKIDMASANINPRTTTPVTSGASTRCTPMHIRSRMRWSRSPIRSPRWSSKTKDRSTTGCSPVWQKVACSPARIRASMNSRGLM